MSTELAKRFIFLILVLTLSSCATASWRRVAGSTTNFYTAHNDCVMKASVAVGYQRGWVYNNRRNAFIVECMQGQGFILDENDGSDS
jgi:hypothetical protein